jgi:hypothetical protein
MWICLTQEVNIVGKWKWREVVNTKSGHGILRDYRPQCEGQHNIKKHREHSSKFLGSGNLTLNEKTNSPLCQREKY